MPFVHHTILHFVLGLAFLPPLLGAVAWRRNGGVWSLELRLIVYMIALTAVIAAGSGLLSAEHVIEGGMDASRVALHRNFALAATALWLLIAAGTLWAARRDDGRRYRTLTVVAAVGTASVSIAGHFGGDMLHPGLAPWAQAPHHHGPTAGSGAADHGAMPDDHHAASTATGNAPSAGQVAPQHSGIAMPSDVPPGVMSAPSATTMPPHGSHGAHAH